MEANDSKMEAIRMDKFVEVGRANSVYIAYCILLIVHSLTMSSGSQKSAFHRRIMMKSL
jgi:hypothetical protein